MQNILCHVSLQNVELYVCRQQFCTDVGCAVYTLHKKYEYHVSDYAITDHDHAVTNHYHSIT